MKCPDCGGRLEPWYWMDGGYKGLECKTCDRRWWSGEMAQRFHDALDPLIRMAEQLVIDLSSFPSDAETEEDRTKEIRKRHGFR